MTMDTVNGLFELGGALITLLSVRQLLRDREMRGFHWGPTIFFTVWGCWNLAYYPHLRQPLSTLGALALVAVNLLYLGQMLRFRRRRTVVGTGQLFFDNRPIGTLRDVQFLDEERVRRAVRSIRERDPRALR